MNRKQKKDLEKDKMGRKRHCRSEETGPFREVHGLSLSSAGAMDLNGKTGFQIFTHL